MSFKVFLKFTKGSWKKTELSFDEKVSRSLGFRGFIPVQQQMYYRYVEPDVDVWAAAAVIDKALVDNPDTEIKDAKELKTMIIEATR